MYDPIALLHDAADLVRSQELPFIYKQRILMVLRSARLYLVNIEGYHNSRTKNGSTVNKLNFSKKSV
jgi:hypothetical protein